MKKILLTLIIAACTLFLKPCFAQFGVYHSFPHTNASWCQTDQWLDQSLTCPQFPNNVITSYYDYYVNGDTVVNSKTYFKVRKSGGYEVGNFCTPSYDNDYDFLAGLLREDTTAKKVYLSVWSNWGRDTLLYDFTLNRGDYLPPSYLTLSNDSTFILSIDSILVNTSYRKQFIIAQYKSHPHIFDSIIEGVGSMCGLLSIIYPPFEASSWLTGFQNGATIFPAGDTSNRYFLSTENIQMPTPNKITVYPNPSNGVFNVICHSERSEESLPIINMYNMLGEQVLTETLRSAQGDNAIDLSNQPNGIYFYRVIANSGELMGEGKMIIQK